MIQEENKLSQSEGASRLEEEEHLKYVISIVGENVKNYTVQSAQMKTDIEDMWKRYHDNDVELYTTLCNTITMYEHMKRALERNEKAMNKPYFGSIVYHDELLNRTESIYIGKGGISVDTTHQLVIDWRAPVANAYYENGLGRCSYISPGGEVTIDLQRKRTYEIENGRLLEYFDAELIANDDLLTKYLAKNKQAVLGEIIATIQKEQNEIIRKTPHHNLIVQGVAGSGKTTVAMHRISYILYNYGERFKPEDFYIIGSNQILLQYITSGLPDLDVHGVRQMTMEQLFVRLLYEAWNDKKYRIHYGIRQENLYKPQQANRGSRLWFHELKDYCDRIELSCIPRESVYLHGKQLLEGSGNGIEEQETWPEDSVLLMDGNRIESYIRQNPEVSVLNKIDRLKEQLITRVKNEITGKDISYTATERREIINACRKHFGGKNRKLSIYELYRRFLKEQKEKGMEVYIPNIEFDVYDLAALAYLYKRFQETEVIREAQHMVIDEAQDYGIMAYEVLHFCVRGCTYTVMGDVTQNIHFGHGLNDWEELKQVLLSGDRDSFQMLRKSYRNTVEISEFAAGILAHGHFAIYPAEPIIRHGSPVTLQKVEKTVLFREAARVCQRWQAEGYETIAVICRKEDEAMQAVQEIGRWITVMENHPAQANFGAGVMILSVEYTKGLEFDAVLLLNPTREDYPEEDGYAKLLYVAATRALHELCVLYEGELTGLIADPIKVIDFS